MTKKPFWKDTLIVGLALFATFFGAGNLIFPPQIGLFSGDAWGWGVLGLLLTGIILPVLAIWAIANVGNDARDLMGHIHPKFYDAFYLITSLLLAIGSTLPRTAALSHEIGIQPLFPDFPNWATILIFFALLYFFAYNPTTVIDKVGKYMTPILLILLAIILIKGVVTPVGTPIDTGIEQPLGDAMLAAYNIGDLTIGILFGGVILGDLKRRGYNRKECQKGSIVVGLISIVCLFAIYGTLTYIGATGSGSYAQDTTQTALLSGLIQDILGRVGLALMGAVVFVAGLTTVIGIATTVITFFYNFFKQKIPYKVLLLIACVASVFMALTGVQNIVNYVTPIFLVVYPMCITMTFLGLINQFLQNDGFYKGGVLVAGIVSLGDAVLSVVPNLPWLQNLMSLFPLSGLGFAWVIPTIIGAIVGAILYRGKPKYAPLPEAEELAD